jgi:hypothetical protein
VAAPADLARPPIFPPCPNNIAAGVLITWLAMGDAGCQAKRSFGTPDPAPYAKNTVVVVYLHS